MKKNIAVLGSTGSVGTQTLEVARNLGIKIHALSANKNITLLEQQIREFNPKIAAVFCEASAKELREKVKDTSTKIVTKTCGLCEAATQKHAEIVVTAVSGMIGLEPTLAAIDAKKDIALANKEALVAGGELVINKAKNCNVKILPVDSEHSAIFQCLEGCRDKSDLQKLILTASGGPFFGKKKAELECVSIKDALNHPSWNMGAKITIDSATMMNKGLEIIEAVRLFDMPENQIDVVVHPQSIVHSMIVYKDGCTIAQMGTPSMKLPIQYALTYPKRFLCAAKPLELEKIQNLSFFPPDCTAFEAMTLCRKAIKIGGTAPTVINAANEEAVGMFLAGQIKFTDITRLACLALNHFEIKKITSLHQITEAERNSRLFVRTLCKDS